MSNIYTSYIRVYKRNRLDLTKEEIDEVFQLAVRAYEEFGSYWVRILKKYREPEKCLDIQFGSGKRYHSGNLLEDKAIYDKYDVWERFADEGGGADTIFTLEYDGQWVDSTRSVSCTYAFDTVRVFAYEDAPYFEQYKSGQDYEDCGDYFRINLAGTYFACNSRSFMDIYEDSKSCGPQMGYDPHYASDYFMPTDDGGVTDSPLKFIQDIFVYPNEQLPENVKVVLYWKNRLVQSVERRHGYVMCLSADYWDNCVDVNYLSFKSGL